MNGQNNLPRGAIEIVRDEENGTIREGSRIYAIENGRKVLQGFDFSRDDKPTEVSDSARKERVIDNIIEGFVNGQGRPKKEKPVYHEVIEPVIVKPKNKQKHVILQLATEVSLVARNNGLYTFEVPEPYHSLYQDFARSYPAITKADSFFSFFIGESLIEKAITKTGYDFAKKRGLPQASHCAGLCLEFYPEVSYGGVLKTHAETMHNLQVGYGCMDGFGYGTFIGNMNSRDVLLADFYIHDQLVTSVKEE